MPEVLDLLRRRPWRSKDCFQASDGNQAVAAVPEECWAEEQEKARRQSVRADASWRDWVVGLGSSDDWLLTGLLRLLPVVGRRMLTVDPGGIPVVVVRDDRAEEVEMVLAINRLN